MSKSQVKIDYTRIPQLELRNLCRVFSNAIKESYSDSKNRKAFKEWQTERKRKEAK